jgi:hypothetical protein
MPKYRGITVQIISERDAKQFPEFPLPDSSQCGPLGASHQSGAPMMMSSPKADRLLGRNPMFSVYVPAVQGEHLTCGITVQH